MKMMHERLEIIIYRKTSEGTHNYYDLKTQVPEIVLEETSRRLKILDKIIDMHNIKYQDWSLFGLRVEELLRKENLLKGDYGEKEDE